MEHNEKIYRLIIDHYGNPTIIDEEETLEQLFESIEDLKETINRLIIKQK